jgi:hypothetical protein
MASYPELEARHVEGARLFANRYDLIRELNLPKNPVIAEIGVALGDFSRFLIDCLRPSQFHAFDIFLLHTEEVIWGRPAAEVLGNKSHLEFYRNATRDLEIIIHDGPSSETLPEIEDKSLDLSYIDGAHYYDAVVKDAEESVRALKPGGVIIFNDYIAHDAYQRSDYHVIQVANRLIVENDWRVIGLALQRDMFCDIAITRNPSA